MELIVITQPGFYPEETAACNRLFAEGLRRLHLRKPGATQEQLAAWLEGIEPACRRRIVAHDYHSLALHYGLGGIHLNRRNPEAPGWLDRSRFTLSRSCHTIAEAEACRKDFDYIFLSPVFDSISKPGYKAAFAEEDLAEAGMRGILRENVFALGGVTFRNLREVERLGFRGAAMMGGFWNTPHPPFCEGQFSAINL